MFHFNLANNCYHYTLIGNDSYVQKKHLYLLCCRAYESEWFHLIIVCYSHFIDLRPLDMLSEIISPNKSLAGLKMVQSQGVRGFHLSGSPHVLSFPSSHLFHNCNLFPEEFSIVITVKIPSLPPKVTVLLYNNSCCAGEYPKPIHLLKTNFNPTTFSGLV